MKSRKRRLLRRMALTGNGGRGFDSRRRNKTKFDNMRKAKEYLNNIMQINAGYAAMKVIRDRYPDDANDEDISKDDLQVMIALMKEILKCKEKVNDVKPEDVTFMETIQNLYNEK